MSWDDWNGNLAIYYSQEHIMFRPEAEWKEVAQNMCNTQSFSIFPLPDPSNYENWQDWAKEFTLIVNQKPVNSPAIVAPQNNGRSNYLFVSDVTNTSGRVRY
jgi:hypothetical protein